MINLSKEGGNQYRSIIEHKEKVSEEFVIETSVKQGCVLSSILFILILDEVMKTVTGDKMGKNSKT